MNKFNQLVARCKCGVHLSVNAHRDVYAPAAEFIDDMYAGQGPGDLESAVRAKIIETDTVVTLQFYPDTPIGFYVVVHHDVDAAIDQALAILESEQ